MPRVCRWSQFRFAFGVHNPAKTQRRKENRPSSVISIVPSSEVTFDLTCGLGQGDPSQWGPIIEATTCDITDFIGRRPLATRRKNQADPAERITHVQNPLTDLISRIGQEIVDENCVLFVGSGSSTEKWQRDHSFYSTIRAKTSFDDSEVRTFPEVMQKFCDEHGVGNEGRPVSYGLKDVGESGKRDVSGTRRLRSNSLIQCGNKRFATASSHHCQSGFLQQFRPIARRDFLCLFDEGSLFVRAEFRWRRSSRCNFYTELHEKVFLACRRTDAEKPGCA